MKRVGIGKKLRFEIFERDKFTCQYCGRTPIEDGLVLHVDHVISVKNGGDNGKNNLTTSCSDCNLGKGAKTTIKKGQTPAEVRKQLDETRERLEQIVAMNEAMREMTAIKNEIAIQKYDWVHDVLGESFNEVLYKEIQKTLESKSFRDLSVQDKKDALEITKLKFEKGSLKVVPDFIKYFCGVLKNIGLDEVEKEVLKLYYGFFQEHYRTPIYPKTRELILMVAYWGVEYHQYFVKKIDKELLRYSGKAIKANDCTQEYANITEYRASNSGAGFNYFVCDFICYELNKNNEEGL